MYLSQVRAMPHPLFWTPSPLDNAAILDGSEIREGVVECGIE